MLKSSTMEKLLQNKLFADVKPEELSKFDDRIFVEKLYPANKLVVEQNSYADEMYLIVAGEVKITNMLDDNTSVELVKRKAGSFVGELGLLEGDLRSANIVSVTPCELIVIQRDDFFRILYAFPAVNKRLIQTLADRLLQSTDRSKSQAEQNLECESLLQTITNQKMELEQFNQRLQKEIEAHKRTEETLQSAQRDIEAARKVKVQAEIQDLGTFTGTSAPMRQVYDAILKAAPIDLTVMIQGETGVGKDLVATALHRLSPRRDKPFVPVNCGAIPPDLAESELFGHEKGAFSGAGATMLGKFELSDGGVLFLDEVAELSPNVQTKLLRVLETHQIWRVGGSSHRQVDVRIIVASHKSLAKEVELGNFRSDLYHRLNVLNIVVPPLREHKGDIPLLAFHFLARYNDQMKKEIAGFSKAALAALYDYHWPGNVRELDNTIAKGMFVHEQGNMLTFLDLFPDQNRHNESDHQEIVDRISHPISQEQLTNLFLTLEGKSLADKLARVEKKLIQISLKQSRYNKSHTAAALGIDRKRLYQLLDRYHIKTSSGPKK